MFQDVIKLRRMEWINIRDILDGLQITAGIWSNARTLRVELPIIKEHLLQELVNQIFEMSFYEPLVTAKLCTYLKETIDKKRYESNMPEGWLQRRLRTTLKHQQTNKQELQETAKQLETTNLRFWELLLNKCQQSFEKYINDVPNIENRVEKIEGTPAQVQEKKKELKLLLDENKKKFLGLLIFMARLYSSANNQLSLATSITIMRCCLTTLLSQEAEEPFLVECLCGLYAAIGQTLKTRITEEPPEFDGYFSKLAQKSQDSELSSSIKDSLQHLVEQRQMKWLKQSFLKLRMEVERRGKVFESMLQGPEGRLPGSNQKSVKWLESGNKYQTSSSGATDAGKSLGGSGAFSQWTNHASTRRLGDSIKRPVGSRLVTNRFALLGQANSSSRTNSSSMGGMERRVSGSGRNMNENLRGIRGNQRRQMGGGLSSRGNSRPHFAQPGRFSASSEVTLHPLPT
uniref:MIF4G domain-containing protein n=2 Tax=Lygus hesperus TaxID=30085 RepID=A0A0K8TG14_LYGHE